MSADLIAILAETTLAGSAALLLVLALRRPVRAALGANAAYALWLCVPVALLAVLLPRSADVPLALPVAWQVVPVMVVTATPEARAIDWREVLAPLWLAGALASMALLAWQQRRFRRALGPLYRRGDGLYQSRIATAGLPAVAGVLRPRILLPVDFEQRYTAPEQALVLQHERLHVRRGDLVANASAALLRCLFWFNPLLPLALRRFRLDQELACDEGVIARNPRARRHYGEAMLKTHFDELPLPLGCHWQARHPIRERIDMLKRPTPSPLQWMAATLFAVGLSASAGYAAWAAQPAAASVGAGSTDAGRYLLTRQSSDGGPLGSGVLNQWVDAGDAAVSVIGSGKGQWKNTARIEPGPQPGTVTLRMTIEQGDPGRVVASPTVVMRVGEAGAIEHSSDAGALVYRTQFRVLPLSGSEQETQQRMNALLAGDMAAAVDHREEPVDTEIAAIEHKLPPPVYPREAAQQGQSGQVVALIDVDAQGIATRIEIEKSQPAGVFDQVTLDAIRQWRFRPAIRNGRPVPGRIRVPVTFTTDEAAQAPPAGRRDDEQYQWFALSRDEVSQAICDVVQIDRDDPEAPAYCGFRREVTAR